MALALPIHSRQYRECGTRTANALFKISGMTLTRAALLLLMIFTLPHRVMAVNSVVVESKTVEPGQTACTVGVFLTNEVPIISIVLPLELRSVSGGAYVRGPFPSSFKFGHRLGARLDNSPLGTAGDSWPEAFRVSQRYATPTEDPCSGPISNSYGDPTSTIDGVSPDAVMYASVSFGDPSIGEEIYLPAGSDAEGTENASIRFIFNVDSLIGCFRIDTCCCRPSVHLAMVSDNVPELDGAGYISVDFDWGMISVGADSCPGGMNPAANNRPNAVCRDSIVLVADSSCHATILPEDIDNGSWDVEDGANLYKAIDPPGPYRIGANDVRLIVCDQDGDCSSCPFVIVVEDTVTPAVAAEHDTMYFRVTGNPSVDTMCHENALSIAGCGVIPTAHAQNSWLFDDDFVGPWVHRTAIRVCLNSTLANNAPNGVYEGAIVLGVFGGGATDTVVVVIELDHPPVEPGCDTVCGFVLTMDGEPIAGAAMWAYTCLLGNGQCAPIPGSFGLSRNDGSFCIDTDDWPNPQIAAQASGFYEAIAEVTGCGGPPTFVYLEESGPIFPGGGPPGAAPVCAAHGFVLANGEWTDPVVGALVQLWESYPDGVILVEDSTDDFGHFGLGQLSGDVVVRAHGFCSTVMEDVTCASTPIEIAVDSIPYSDRPNWPYFTDYFSTNAQFVSGDVPYPILPGDVIYATDPQGVLCGVTWVEEEGAYLLHVLGDDPETAVDEGAIPGDVITLWLNCVCAVTTPDTWANFGSFQFDAVWDCEPEVLCCTLCEGWNMWSYNIQAPSYARPDVLATIDLNYDALRSGLCAYGSISWFAGRPINDLENVPPWFGYDIHMLQEDTVCLEGDFVDPSTPIYLCEGWNYIPYLPGTPDNLAHALQSLAGNYTHIFTMYCDYGVASWNASRPINDLICVEPCHGYWIEMMSDDTLIYPEPEGCDPLAKVGTRANGGRVAATPLVADYYASSSQVAEGSLISARSTSGALIGEASVGAGGSFLIHVYGDVPGTPQVEGAVHGESLSFEVDGVAVSANHEIRWMDRDNQAITLTAGAAAAIPTEYALHQNYPNPFNAGTVISFDLRDDATWTISIYNIMGQLVRSLEGQSSAGRTRVQWNGRDESGASLASGVYFYRLSANDFRDFKKMMLVK